MMQTNERLSRARHEELFPEFRTATDDSPAVATEEAAAAEAPPPSREPVVLSVMAKLAACLAEETRLIRAGDFDGFNEIQREKGLLIRQAERLEHSRASLDEVQGMEPGRLQERLEDFNTTIENNMRAIGAVKDAIFHIREQAIRKLEEEKGDGVYSRDGGKKSLHHLSLNETQVKL